jgi:hypothetical protein
MTDWRNTGTISGSLAVAAMLALMSPGVTAVRADEATAFSGSQLEGATCEAGSVAGADEVLDTIRLVQHMQAQQLAEQPAGPPGSGDFVVLNGRGYNYGPAQLQLPSPRELPHGR